MSIFSPWMRQNQQMMKMTIGGLFTHCIQDGVQQNRPHRPTSTFTSWTCGKYQGTYFLLPFLHKTNSFLLLFSLTLPPNTQVFWYACLFLGYAMHLL